jgi:long-chain acyl-CoA synthetase
MISNQNICSVIASLKLHPDFNVQKDDRTLSFLPLPHILERLTVYSLFVFGASTVTFSGLITKMSDDLKLVKPTIFIGVPRLYTRFYDVFQDKFS